MDQNKSPHPNPVVDAFSIKAVKRVRSGDQYYTVGSVVVYADGTGRVTMNHIPNQEYHLSRKREQK